MIAQRPLYLQPHRQHAYQRAMAQARRISKAKDKPRAVHTWAKWMHEVIEA